MAIEKLKKILKYPSESHMGTDTPEMSLSHGEIIRKKGFLKRLYDHWYRTITGEIPSQITGAVLELGSGSGFLKNHMPELITSDIMALPHVDVRLDASNLPFSNDSLKAVVMHEVFHHLPDSAAFIAEAERCVKAGGRIIMVEPWVTLWSRFIYGCVHHEPFDPEAPGWRMPVGHPLSMANGALPWIVFSRDRELLEKRFPNWRIEKIELDMPFSYIVSGGVSFKSIMPGFCYEKFRAIERLFWPWRHLLALFSLIVLEKKKGLESL